MIVSRVCVVALASGLVSDSKSWCFVCVFGVVGVVCVFCACVACLCVLV